MSDVAVCILADSSLQLASQWNTVTVSYISNLLSRLHEGRSSESFYISVVTYATAGYYPTPVLAKRYFNLPKSVTRELKEDVPKLGIGQTGPGTKTGMAALEGYAAALEMFDLFLSSHRATKDVPQDKQPAETAIGPLSHIIHVSACPPDDTQYPSWNQTTTLDTLSWKTLPDELRKRNINLNMILVKPNKSFTELHSTVHPEAHKAWFKIPDSTHTVLLSSELSWAPIVVKQSAEAAAEPDKPVDTKKTRAPTPKATAPLPQIPAPTKSSENEQPPPSTQSNSAPMPISLQQLQQIVLEMRKLEPELKQAQTRMDILRQQGLAQEAENLRRSLAPKIQLYLHCKQAVLRAQAQMKKSVAVATAAARAAASSNSDTAKLEESRPGSIAGPSRQSQQSGQGSSSVTPVQPQQIAPAQPMQQALQAQLQAHQYNRPGTSTADVRQPPNVLPQISPNIAAQMQKLQMKEGIPGLSAMPHHQPQQFQPPMNQPTQHAPAQSQNQPAGTNENRTWLGTLSWMHPQTMNRMEAQVQMQANRAIQPQQWPSMLEIELLNQQPVPLGALKEWVSRYGPVLCHIAPFPRSVDPSENALAYKSLVTHINEKNIYAVGMRAPSMENTNPFLLLFPMGGEGRQLALAAAVFPETGVPEIPRVNPNAQLAPNVRPVPEARPPIAAAGPQPVSNLSPQILAVLQNMTPEQKAEFNRFRLQQQARAQMQSQQTASGANINPVNVNLGNLNAGANPLANLSGGGWPGGGVPGGQSMPGVQPGMSGGMNANANANLVQALAAMQQQRQAGMQPRPGSGAPPPF